MKFPLISVAPMMDYTDRHDRYFLRLLSPNILLYTEMLTAQKLTDSDPHYVLSYDQAEHPLALQLGGSDPRLLAEAAKLGGDFGYDEINLNVGCPSPRVSKGRFGACLMFEPNLVADCVSAMQEAVSIPVTVKCRIGVDKLDSYENLQQFVRVVAEAGCKTFIVHARKAWLSGLSPKQNREIPPLRYDVVYQLKKDFPYLTIILNGGIKTIKEIDDHLSYVDGVMIGREAYANPYFLARIQSHYFLEGSRENAMEMSREDVIEKFIPYVRQQLNRGIKLSAMTRHILGLFQGQRGGAIWRRYLSEHAHKHEASVQIIQNALEMKKV